MVLPLKVNYSVQSSPMQWQFNGDGGDSFTFCFASMLTQIERWRYHDDHSSFFGGKFMRKLNLSCVRFDKCVCFIFSKRNKFNNNIYFFSARSNFPDEFLSYFNACHRLIESINIWEKVFDVVKKLAVIVCTRELGFVCLFSFVARRWNFFAF